MTLVIRLNRAFLHCLCIWYGEFYKETNRGKEFILERSLEKGLICDESSQSHREGGQEGQFVQGIPLLGSVRCSSKRTS